jgi:hypothetical protein
MTCRTMSRLLIINLFITLPPQKQLIFMAQRLSMDNSSWGMRPIDMFSLSYPSPSLSPLPPVVRLCSPELKGDFDYTLYSRTGKEKKAKRCHLSQNPVVLRVWKRPKSSLLAIISRPSKKGFSGLRKDNLVLRAQGGRRKRQIINCK